jgi:hypothetical protein
MCLCLEDFLHFGIYLFIFPLKMIFVFVFFMKMYKYVNAIMWYLCMIGPPNKGKGQISNHMEFFGKSFKCELWSWKLQRQLTNL